MGVILYKVVRFLVAVLGRVYFRLRVTGTEHVPAEGPFVLAPVHRSNLDFVLVAVLTHRQLRYMGKASIWKYKWFGKIVTSMGAYPVERGAADREALNRTIAVLDAGDGTVLFPEGTRRSGPVVEDLFEGASYVAARAGAPIVPVGIGGSERAMGKGAKWPRPHKICIVVGPPLQPPAPREDGRRASRKAVHELTVQLRDELQRLFDEAQLEAGSAT